MHKRPTDLSHRCHQCRDRAGKHTTTCHEGPDLLTEAVVEKQQGAREGVAVPGLYSPTSALQNACCGCTGAQLQASTSSSACQRMSTVRVQSMPLIDNGIFSSCVSVVYRIESEIRRVGCRCVSVWVGYVSTATMTVNQDQITEEKPQSASCPSQGKNKCVAFTLSRCAFLSFGCVFISP